MSETPTPNPQGDSPHQAQPNFPPEVRERYAAEDLQFASPETVGLIAEELSILSQRQGVTNEAIRIGKGSTKEGQRLFVTSTEHIKATTKSPSITMSGHYSVNSADSVRLENMPHFYATLKERVQPSYELQLPENHSESNEVVDHFWVYDHQVDDSQADSFEPVIYRVSSTRGSASQEGPGNFIDAEEFELARTSGNLHRLSETEAKDFLSKIQSVEAN